MDKQISQMFFEYIPATDFIDALEMHPRDLIFRAMRKQITLYYPVRSEKYLTYYPVTKTNSSLKALWMTLRTFLFLSIGLDNRRYQSGQIIPIRGIDTLNNLATNSLNESLIFSYCYETDSITHRHEILRNKFHEVNFCDVLVEVDDALQLRQIVLDEKAHLEEENQSSEGQDTLTKPLTKQAKREEVLLIWLKEKELQGINRDQVSNMKKDDVWKELQEMDRRLFNVEPKNFFRDQKIITFKSGRKAN